MVALSPLGGAGWQFFDNNGIPLAGGKLYTYSAGTTTPAITYTTNAGTPGTENSNPIILDSAGRVTSEIWLLSATAYKFRLDTANDATLWVKDNIPGIFADAALTADMVTYSEGSPGAVDRTVEDRLQDYVSVKDFGAVGDGVTDDTAAIQSALDALALNGGGKLYLPGDFTYLLATKSAVSGETAFLRIPNNVEIVGPRSAIVKLAANVGNYAGVFMPAVAAGNTASNVILNGFTIDQNAANNSTCDITPNVVEKTLAAILFLRKCEKVYVKNCMFLNAPGVNTVCINGALSSDIRVDDNHIEFLRGTSSIPDSYDNSAVYIEANGYSCCRNYVINTSVSGGGTFEGGRTAIETHGSSGLVCDNWMVKFQKAANVVGHLLGQDLPEFNRTIVSRNMAFQCRSGISLWSLTGSDFKGFIVSDNTLELNPTLFKDDASTINGIDTVVDAGAAGAFQAGIISNNIIHFLGDIETALAANRSAGIAVDCLGAVSDVQIVDNMIYMSPFSGISIFQQTGAFDNIVVKGNTIVDAGQNSLSAIRFGILWRGTVTNGQCTDNLCVETTATIKVLNAVSTQLVAGGSITTGRNYTRAPLSSSLLRNASGAYDVVAGWATPAFSGALVTLSPDTDDTNFRIVVDSTAARTAAIFATAVAATGTEISVQVINTSGGTTNLAWTASYEFSTPWVQLTAGQRATLKFTYDQATSKWYQSSPQMTVTS